MMLGPLMSADESPPERPSFVPPAAGVRWLLFGSGFVCVGLGAVGAFLPVLPTTPFLLLAAACCARSSRRWHDWLLGNRVFGPAILDYRRHRAVQRRAKVVAIVLVVVTLGSSIVFFVANPWLRMMLAGIGVCVVTVLARMKTLPPQG